MREKLFAARIKDFNAADAEKSDTPSAEEKQEVFNNRKCIFWSAWMDDINLYYMLINSHGIVLSPLPSLPYTLSLTLIQHHTNSNTTHKQSEEVACWLLQRQARASLIECYAKNETDAQALEIEKAIAIKNGKGPAKTVEGTSRD